MESSKQNNVHCYICASQTRKKIAAAAAASNWHDVRVGKFNQWNI